MTGKILEVPFSASQPPSNSQAHPSDPRNNLPKPPSSFERYNYLNPPRYWAYLGFIASCLVLVSSSWFLWRTHFWIYGIYVFLTSAWTFPHFLFVIFSKNFNPAHHIAMVQQTLEKGHYPAVDVFIPTCGENIEIIENTLYHASKLVYDNLNIYILDDGASAEVERLTRKYAFNYVSRPNRGHMKKAGNLLYGYHRSQGDYILVLDADFAVAPLGLQHLVPWMEQNPKTAIVQTPQYFSTDASLAWSARGAAYCQEVFYRVIQPARDYLGQSAICVGTNALYRRQALAEIGGFYQVEASEDVHNGVALISKGWNIKYLPILIARGLCPDTAQGLFKQHYRWCSGSMRLITSSFFWNSSMAVWQKLIYLCGACYYPATGLSVPAALLQLGVMLLWLQDDVKWYVAFLFLPKVLFVYLIMPLWNQSNWGLHSIKSAITFAWAYLIALGDLATQKTEGWIATGASKTSARYQLFRQLLSVYCVCNLLLLVPTFNEEWYNFLPIAASHGFSLYLSWDLLNHDR
ncbi:glycosyltransferase family 2 protein [Prochlorothrix hollandica]|uniref:glycosyltransferase family 2 protein n=1 Tax=Prochlorothrix hollandica TaxID=1223 RepID=UPI0033429C41